MIKQLLFVTLAFFSLTIYAAPAPAPAETVTEPVPKAYEIELMVFQNIRTDLEGNELWINERINPVLEDIDKAKTVDTAPAEESDLSKAKEIIGHNSNYRVLVHKQWFQTANPRSDAELIRLNTDDGELDGTFKFFISRFLHVDLNLLFREPESKSMFQVGGDEAGNTIAYEIREQRRVKSNEMQYFDHPKFGVLVLVKQVVVDSN